MFIKCYINSFIVFFKRWMIIRSTLLTAFTLIMYSRLSTIISEMVILGDDPFFILGRINRFVVVGQLVARSLHGRVYKSRSRQKVVQINRQSLDNRSLEIILKTDVSCHAKYSPLKSSLLIFCSFFLRRAHIRSYFQSPFNHWVAYPNEWYILEGTYNNCQCSLGSYA